MHSMMWGNSYLKNCFYTSPIRLVPRELATSILKTLTLISRSPGRLKTQPSLNLSLPKLFRLSGVMFSKPQPGASPLTIYNLIIPILIRLSGAMFSMP